MRMPSMTMGQRMKSLYLLDELADGHFVEGDACSDSSTSSLMCMTTSVPTVGFALLDGVAVDAGALPLVGLMEPYALVVTVTLGTTSGRQGRRPTPNWPMM